LTFYSPRAVAASTFTIPISIKGLPPELSSAISVDGKPSGTIPGGGVKSYTVDKKSSHTFQVDAEIKGACQTYEGKTVCTRYKSPNNVWTVDIVKTRECSLVPVCYEVWYCDCCCCWWDYVCTMQEYCYSESELSEKGHTFEYYTEHQVMISDVHGQNIDKWYKDGADLSLTATESVVITDQSDVKEQDIFQKWMVNGVPSEGKILTFKVDEPYYIEADYQKEIQYKISVSSPYGNPVMDNSKGWYMKGQDASVSVEKDLPMEGLMGALGGKEVFVAWHSAKGIESRDPTFAFAVEEPTKLRAEWKEDYTLPTIIAVILVVLIALILVIFGLYRRKRIFAPLRAGTPGPSIIQAPSPPSYVAPHVTGTGARMCFGCGAVVPAGSTSCPRCGKPA
jgi:hypothetical protein